MGRIQQLDAQVVNRIAAGEVIERPGSVVKELLENSVDALSTRIEVDILDGGMQLIRISDNGEGIHRDDMLLAVTSHATSKIRSDADLDHVSSLGFRGEALASIASVSRFRIRTRQEADAVGQELECQGGQITIHRDCGCPAGTVIEVHQLFYNTPARRKFLKKSSTEFGHIAENFSRVALANPALHLVLRHNDKLVYEMPSSHSPLERIRRFYGSEIADKLIPVESESTLPTGESIRLWGYVGEPSLSKSTRKNQYLFLNGRCINDRSLQHALEEAYRGLLMVGRHPVSFLFLEMPPALVDVNVHPTKSEVRFQDGQILYRQLLKTLRDKFLALEFRPAIDVASQRTQPTPPFKPFGSSSLASPSFNSPSFGSSTANRRELDLWASTTAIPAQPPGVAPIAHTAVIEGSPSVPEPWDTPVAPEQTELSPASEHQPAEVTRPNVSKTDVSRTEVIADEFRAFQIYDCYLVVASSEGLEVIDQHALHERILYEHLRQRILAGGVERQRLLIPDPIECSAKEAAVLLEYSDLLKESGFEIEEFGGTTMLLTAYPVLIPRGNIVQIVRDLAEQLEQTDGKTTRRDLLDRMLHTMSCRAAIKSGQRLTIEEMRELLRQRHLVQDSHHCPHGRPTSLTLTRGILDQQFGRLG
ncbi:MAG: DNA mismatch repair endonuclease MutL [Planctomyces sp.]|nr:DNA mismatch repair endonuclease MutL [Planctomyces sp.]